ncbi:MAG: hypothetical protein ACLU9S_05300 [Oscillospiraceae bacterium]
MRHYGRSITGALLERSQGCAKLTAETMRRVALDADTPGCGWDVHQLHSCAWMVDRPLGTSGVSRY